MNPEQFKDFNLFINYPLNMKQGDIITSSILYDRCSLSLFFEIVKINKNSLRLRNIFFKKQLFSYYFNYYLSIAPSFNDFLILSIKHDNNQLVENGCRYLQHEAGFYTAPRITKHIDSMISKFHSFGRLFIQHNREAIYS